MPPTPDVSHVLDELFTLCRLPFVHDFLFTADPVADIAILTAPVQNEHAIAARITVAGTESSASYAHVFDFSCDMFFCSVPAFSVGPITLGFATQERATDISHAALNAPADKTHVSCSRYVRDDQRGVFLLLSENPRTGITEVDCMSHRSSRRRSRVLALFHTDSLRANLRSANRILHPDDLTKALTYLSVATERRACPVCKRVDPVECGCTLPFKRPAHPLDFRNEKKNMSLHTGLYEGGTTVRLFNQALPFVIADLSSRSVIRGSLDPVVISRLNRYAVQDRMSKLKHNAFSPTISTMPSESALAKREASAEATSDLAPLGLLQGVECTPAALPDASFVQDLGMLQTCNAPILSFDEAFGEETLPLVAAPLGTGTTLLDVARLQDSLLPRSELYTEKSDSAKGGSIWSTEGTSRTRSSSGNNGTTSGTEGTEETEGAEVDGVSTENKRLGMGSDETGRTGLDVKQLKAELRKRRNRAAAARSNIKRKIRNESLRRDLAQVNKKAAELQALEKVLREENVRLRGLANANKFRVSAHLSHIQISRS